MSSNQETGPEMVPIPEGLVPTTIDFSYLNALNSANFGSVSGKLPARHDPRDLTPVRNQDPQDADIGTCWAQATIGSMETWLFLNGFGQNLFSVRNMVNREGWDSNSWFGGNHIRSSAYLLRWDGPVWESDDPYTNKNGIVNFKIGNRNMQIAAALLDIDTFRAMTGLYKNKVEEWIAPDGYKDWNDVLMKEQNR